MQLCGGMPGVSRLGDRAKAPVDVHGCPACPHDVLGPSISASSNVYVNGAPALRQGDLGMHTSCCGTNMWKVIAASGAVFVNGSAMVRKGDPTMHCGGIGKMIDASGNVVDGSPLVTPGPFGVPLLPPLPMNQVKLFPDEIPFCPTEPGALPGVPLSGDPMVYDQQAAQRAEALNRPHAEPGPTAEERIEMAKADAARRWIAGRQPTAEDREAAAQANRELEIAKAALSKVRDGVGRYADARKGAQEAYNRALASHLEAQARLGAAGSTGGRTPRRGR
jgi:uncharacterized Zn-binding protein involved in type VI secretion